MTHAHDMPVDALRVALRKTTEALARELAGPTEAAPDWSTDEWLIARAVASLHGMSPLLSQTLRWQGSPGWRQFLLEQHAHTVKRHGRIERLLGLIDARAREQAIPLVALKGSALHAMGIYEPGERPMADIDLLARAADSPRTARLLEDCGFHEVPGHWKHRTFEPNDGGAPGTLGEHADNAIKIELHVRVAEMLPLRKTDVTEHLFPRQPQPGINDYPSPAALFLHVLLHAAGAMCFCAIRLLHLHDISRLAARLTDEDWDEFLRLGSAQAQTLWWAFPPLALTARYSPLVPQRVLAVVALACPRRLRRSAQRLTLSDVSLSNLRIRAFPGIEWASSLGEAVAYAKQRLVPDAETRALRAYVGRVHPALAGSSWGSQSHGVRVIRWLASRPLRPDTLFAVRNALGRAP